MRKTIEVTAAQGLSSIIQAWNNRPHGDYACSFDEWFSANIEDFEYLATGLNLIYRLEVKGEHAHRRQGKPAAQEREEVRGDQDQGGEEEEGQGRQEGEGQGHVDQEGQAEERQARQGRRVAQRTLG